MSDNYIFPPNPEYSEEIRKLRDQDPSSASYTFNPLVQQLVNNIHAVKKGTEALDQRFVPSTRTVNSKSLSGDITLAAADIGAVPVTRTVNTKALSGDITLVAADVGAVPVTRKVNNKPLSGDITLTAADVGAIAAGEVIGGIVSETDPTVPAWAKAASKPSYTAAEVGAVPTTRTVNNKALSANISLTAADIGAITSESDPTVPAWAKASAKPSYTAAEVGAVPTTRTVNSKALSANITLTADDLSAVPTTRTVNNKALSANISLAAADVGAVPTTRTVNSKALSANIALTAADVAAVTLVSGKAQADQISATITALTASTTLALAHAGCYLEVSSTSALTITIPTNASVAFPIGTEIEVAREGTGTVTIAAASGVTLQSMGGARAISAQYGVVALKKRATNDWRLAGDLA